MQAPVHRREPRPGQARTRLRGARRWRAHGHRAQVRNGEAAADRGQGRL